MADKHVVLAIFDSEAAADTAVASLKGWDQIDEDIKLNAIGVLVLDEKGEVKQHKVGKRNTGKGAGIGLVLGALAVTAATAGTALVVGAAAGALVHKSLGLSKEDTARIAGELKGGKAAVGVLAATEQSDAISAKLAQLGGTPETYNVSDAALVEVATAADAPAAAPAAAS